MASGRLTWMFCALIAAVSSLPALAQEANIPAEVRAQIAEMGAHLNPEIFRKTIALMRPLLADRTGLSLSKDLAYGSNPLQKLDLYAQQGNAAGPAPIIMFVHGRAFSRGDKRFGENVAAYFARHGMLGVTMNYRLAPAVTWPAQSLDVGAAVAWLKANARHYGGDPRHIILIGHSAGAADVASYLFDPSINTVRAGVVGAVLISGVYGYQLSFPIYYGQDPIAAARREPRSHVNDMRLPVMLVTAEFDPPRGGGGNTYELAAAICISERKCPPVLLLAGHNHVSEVRSIDTKDDRLGAAIREFVGKVTK